MLRFTVTDYGPVATHGDPICAKKCDFGGRCLLDSSGPSGNRHEPFWIHQALPEPEVRALPDCHWALPETLRSVPSGFSHQRPLRNKRSGPSRFIGPFRKQKVGPIQIQNFIRSKVKECCSKPSFWEFIQRIPRKRCSGPLLGTSLHTRRGSG